MYRNCVIMTTLIKGASKQALFNGFKQMYKFKVILKTPFVERYILKNLFKTNKLLLHVLKFLTDLHAQFL